MFFFRDVGRRILFGCMSCHYMFRYTYTCMWEQQHIYKRTNTKIHTNKIPLPTLKKNKKNKKIKNTTHINRPFFFFKKPFTLMNV